MVPNNHDAACFMFLFILWRLDLFVHGFTGITIRSCKPTHRQLDVFLYNTNNEPLSTISKSDNNNNNNKILLKQDDVSPTATTVLIHWKGEGTEGSTLQFRHVEFQGALQAVLLQANRHSNDDDDDDDDASKYNSLNDDYTISFSNALEYSGEAEMPMHKRIRFNSAMQYLHLDEYHHGRHANDDDDNDNEQRRASTTMTTKRIIPTLELLIQAAQRCSLIHAMYQVVATVPSHESYEKLSERAVQVGLLQSMSRGNVEQHATWCVRVRRYYGGDNPNSDGGNDDDADFAAESNNNNTLDSGREKRRKREKRHGERTRSLSLERRALQALEPLLLTFGGGVDLQNPDCKLYIMDGLIQQQRPQPSLLVRDEVQQQQQQEQEQVKILARRIAMGPRVSIMAPATRICITNTPLCPMAAFWMCNIAGIRPGQSILDPFAGSCSILLAAAMMMIHNNAPCRTVGIEIAHDGLVNRHDIRRDFATRNLTLPCDLIHGDCTDVDVRRRAKRALRNVFHDDDDDHHGKQHQHDDHDDDDNDNDVSTLPSFDYIITDPPYGIRESTNYNSKTPLQELFQAIAHDRQAAAISNPNETPLLKPGGKLVCFVPVNTGEDLFDVLPSQAEQDRAGLVLQKEIMQEQPLNENLSRWLLCFHSV